jgi:hypothetical protein
MTHRLITYADTRAFVIVQAGRVISGTDQLFLPFIPVCTLLRGERGGGLSADQLAETDKDTYMEPPLSKKWLLSDYPKKTKRGDLQRCAHLQ